MTIEAKAVDNWQLTEPVDAITFDCDGTLSHIEGINELAAANQVEEEVTQLTERAMSETGIDRALYTQRIELVKPRRSQLIDLGQQYYFNRAPEVEHVITLLQRMGKTIYILTAGLQLAVTIFGGLIQITHDKIYGVKLTFDADGNYLDYDRAAPTANRNGKCSLIEKLSHIHPRIVHIGDGMNDYDVSGQVVRFVGYGGMQIREHMVELCDAYIKAPVIAALLPLCLTAKEVAQLSPQEKPLYDQGNAAIESGNVVFNSIDARQ